MSLRCSLWYRPRAPLHSFPPLFLLTSRHTFFYFASSSSLFTMIFLTVFFSFFFTTTFLALHYALVGWLLPGDSSCAWVNTVIFSFRLFERNWQTAKLQEPSKIVEINVNLFTWNKHELIAKKKYYSLRKRTIAGRHESKQINIKSGNADLPSFSLKTKPIFPRDFST